MAISELQNIRNELARIRSGGASQSPTAVAQTDLKNSEKNNGGLLGGIGYVGEKLGLGILRSVEGVTDFLVGGVADLFGGDEFAENVMKNDWINYSHADEWYDPGKGMSFVGDVAGGVGNMLPSIIITAATAGAAAPVALAGSIASTGQFIGSAMGQSVSESVKESGTLGGKEWLYGTASGALEGGIEYLSGGIGGSQVGKVLGKQLGKSTLGKIGMTVVGEGLEEVASDIANPLLKRATGVDKNAEIDWKGLPRTFAVGGATGAVIGGGKRVIDAAKVGGFNNLNTIESAQELTERQADNNIRQLKGKTATYTQEDIARTKENLSKRLQKMDATNRKMFLENNANIANQFNEDGTVKSVAPAPDTYNANAYSASLQGREGTFAYKPIAESSKATAQAKQVMDTLTKITDGKTNIVLTEDALTTGSGGNANGLYKDGIIYLNANATDYQKALTVGVHEVIHGLEGTKEYEQLAKAITEEIKNDPDLAQQYNIDKYRATYDSILEGEWTETTKDYQAVTEIFADFLANKVANNEQLLRNLSVRNSNVVVRFLNWVRNSIAKLGESAEERAVRKDLKKLEKMLVNALEAGTGGISLERVEELSKSAEKRLKTQDGNIQSVKFSETVDNKSAVGYNKAQARASINKTPYIQWKSDALAGANNKRTQIGDMNSGADANYYYFYEAIDGYDEGKANDYRVLTKIPSNNQQLIDEWEGEVRKNNERNHPEGSDSVLYESADECERTISQYQGNNTNVLGQSTANVGVGAVDQRQSKSNGKRNNSQSGRNTSGQVVKKSANLQDIAYENIVKRGDMAKAQKLVEEAAKGWGAISIDKQQGVVTDGTPTVLYHGTSNYGFTEFETRLPGAMEGTDSIFMSVDEFTASEYKNGEKGGVYKLYAKIAKPLVIDCNGAAANSILLKQDALDLARKYVKNAWEHVDANENKFSTDQIAYAALQSGKYDGVVFENVVDSYRGAKKTTDVVVFDSKQVKSAEPATYDDNGNLIPLSKRFNKKSADIRYSLPVDIEADVKKYYGSTYRWNETGYILQDGTRLDLSGRNEGARGGYRAVDHRDIFDIVDSDVDGTDAMIEFIARGNIRVMPETPGINLSVEPNAEQYRLIQDFVERVGWNEGYFSVDIDNKNGDTIETLTYEGKPSGRKVVADLKQYFKTGEKPYQSKLSAFRYSIDVDAALADFPSIDKWFESLTAEELRELIDNDYSVKDISEELNVEPQKLRYLIKREGLGNSYVEDSKKAVMKQSRINEAIEDSGATNPTYARRYITRISTKDFIDLTVREDHMDREAFDKEVIGDHGSKMGEYDYDKALQTSRTPYLSIDKASGQVISHNGRHRIRALEKAGIQSVEIEVDFFDEDGRLIKYDAETIPKMAISSQFDTDIETTISNVIPLNESHRTDIEKAYGEKAHPKAGVRYSLNVTEKSIKEAETDRAGRKTSSARFSLKYANEIAERQFKDNEKFGFHVTDEKLSEAIESTARMVDMMSKHLDILPEDKIGKKNETIKSNSSYDKSIENTTICVRTLSYNQFVDKVQERLGRPLTQAESFLASQKLYEIAVDPQCLYCYVSLDRKAYNEFLLRYINERDEVIEEYKKSDKSKSTIEDLYKKFLRGRKGESPDSPMRKRFNMFIEMAEKGIKPLSAKDVSTKARQSEIASRNDYTSVQWKDMAAYAQSASWAKKQQDYVAYFNDILNLSKVAVDNLNKHYGLRFYSFSDYTAAFIVENMQQITDAAIRGLKGLGYTKDVDFARIFAPTGMNINISMYAHINKETGEWEIDPRQSANLEDAIKLRDEYPNVGIVVTASTDEGVDWALKQKWSDVVIPFHIVRTGADVAEFYNWQNYTTESADTIADEKLWNAYVNGRKKVSKNIYPAEHQNNKETYLKLIKERGLKPRFERFLDNPNYMKLVNETRQSAKDTKPMQPTFDVGAAEKSFDAFVGKGGYFKGWYKQGVNVDAEADAVAKDVAEGKKANEVDYGRQDIDTEALMKQRNAVRKHSRAKIDVALDEKTTERVQTVVNNMTMAERWQKVLEDLKLGKADQWIKAQIAWTDEQAGIIQAGKNVGVVVHGEVQRARVAKASAINMLNDSQRDYSGKKRVGDSLKAIFKPIQSRGKKVAQDFNLYLLHQLNVDRMSAEETAIAKRKELLKKFPDLDNAVNGRYANDAEWQSAVKSVDGGKEYLSTFDAENKPVFEKDVDKAFSQEKVQQLEKQYPEFKATAEKVWKYNQNLLQYRVDAGLITQAQADQMTKMYPHYVPAFYEHNGGGTSGAFVGQKGVAVKTGIKSAKGSTGVSNIEDVQTSIARQTVAVIRAASINKIVEKLYDGAMKTKNFVDFEIVGKESMTDPDVNYDTDIPKENQVFFYKDGERITLDVSQYIYAGFRGLTAGAQLGDPLTTLSAKAISLFKKLVTSYNPLFAVTNTLRDAQEAVFYTKYPKRFFANYGKALVTRKSDTRLKELWEQYKAMGGTGSGYFSRETGVFDDRSKLRKGVEWLGDKMQIVNEWVEQAPRFAEFVASVEAGNSLEQALYDSAEVTTNFSRGGKMAKALNRHLIPFLNPSIQGWSKMWRGWVAPMDGKSAAEIERLSKQSKGRRFLSNYGALMFKAILCGVSVGLFNDMLYRWIDDDEDYANLPLNIKENYYLIKVGKKFIKIPKGRVVALYGMVATRAVEAVNGNEEAMNAESWFKSASSMVSPLESASRTILAPFKDAKTNTTWYGGQIENASMENLAPSERYDEGTSKIAIAMGKAFNYSPKKIHYILDQYSGVIGDVILPLTTNKAEKNMVSARFVVDPLYNSDVSTKYYDYKEELTFAKNSGDTNAKLMLKYMNEVQDDLSKMYQQKRDIANDKSLTDKEKREQTEIIQGLINATLSSSVDMADEFEQLLINSGFEQAVGILLNNSTYKKMDEKAQNSAYSKLTEYYYETCLARLNGAKLGTKYTLYGSINATDLVVYLTEIGNIESDKDKKGNTIQGSRKEKVQKYIQRLKITVQQKYILSYLAGYAPTDNGKIAISKYLKNNGYTQKEVNDLWN